MLKICLLLGLMMKFSEDDLIKTFSVYGEVVYSKIIKNKFSQKTKDISFIKFKERKSAFGSMADNGKIFCKGYPLKIKYNIKSKENKYFKDENRFKENLINKKKQANYVKVIVKEVMR